MTTIYLRVPGTGVIYQYTRYKSGNYTRKMIFADNMPCSGTAERITVQEYNEAINTMEKVG